MEEEDAEKLKLSINRMEKSSISNANKETCAITTAARYKQIDKVCIFSRLAKIFLNEL